jgi:hypothetical protein
MDFLRRSSWLASACALAIAGTVASCAAPSEPLGQTQQAQRRTLFFERSPQPLLPKDLRANDEFGTAIGVSSLWAVVGSPRDDFDDFDINDETGSATVFARNGKLWQETATLRPPQRWPYAQFGKAIAVSDSLVAVGALEADPTEDGSKFGVGSVAIYAHVNRGFQFEAFLRDPHEDAERYFGCALAMDDRTLLVGAYGGDEVFAFSRTAQGWTDPITIQSPSPIPKDTAFGFAVALQYPYAFVGAPHDDGDGAAGSQHRGAVYVFKRDDLGWTSQGELERNNYSPQELFGFGVAVREGLVVGTAYGDVSATTYRLDSSGHWQDPFRMVPGDAEQSSAFGRSVAIGPGDVVWVGAARDKNDDGAVFPFLRDGSAWVEAPDISFTDQGRFGYSVAAAAGALMVGAPFAGSDYQGAVYVIETSDGSYCESDEDCASTHCVAGICCNSTCTDPCYSCLASEHASGNRDGTCEPKRAGLPDQACVDEGALSCGTNGRCNGAGSCAKYSANTQCGDPFCSGSDLIGAALCDGAGDCKPPVARGCRSYACNDGACLDECSTPADCSPESYCSEGRCRSQSGLGEACTSPQACLSGNCADGVCCDTACEGSCEACAEPSSAGTCAPLAAGSPPRVLAAPKLSVGEACSRLFCDGVARDTPSLLAGPSVICAPAGCTDGAEVGEGHCDGAGQCLIPPQKDCEAYACSASAEETGRPGQCLTSCTTVDDCAGGFYCTTDRVCRPIESSGWGPRGCSVAPSGTDRDWSCLLGAVSLAVFCLRRGRTTHRKGTHAT